jgi:tripartite-type tricarboxylate transporter receptor subunit TctC
MFSVLRYFPRYLPVVACVLVTTFVLEAAPATAQNWPQRPVKIIVTLGPGSGTDIGMRLFADRLLKRWNQPVIIENRPGGDGLVAITAFLSANDDHVLLGAPVSSFTAHPYVIPNLPYRQSDLAPIARGWNVIIVIAVPASLPVNSLEELVALTKAQPGKLNWAGTTGAIDFLFAGFLKKYNLNMARVPYRNPQDAATDLATERIQICEASLATLRPQLEAGKIKLLAVTNSTRTPSHPHLPTTKEAGYPELTLDGLVGLFGQQSMSIALRERIAADVKDTAKDPIITDRLTLTGQMLNVGGAAEFTASIDEQRRTVAAAAKDLGISPLQ